MELSTPAQYALSSMPAAPLSAKLAVSIAEAAQLLSISRSHLYPIVMRGEIPSFHIGRSHLIRISALEAWIRQQEEAAA
jgi:excisionase family DNA binding protein